MGVDGISKADIFDEYFDDEKPKVTNFEKRKAMDIDEMAGWLYIDTADVYIRCKNCATIHFLNDHIESEVRE